MPFRHCSAAHNRRRSVRARLAGCYGRAVRRDDGISHTPLVPIYDGETTRLVLVSPDTVRLPMSIADDQLVLDVRRLLSADYLTAEDVAAARATLPSVASSFAVAERLAAMKSLPPPRVKWGRTP